MSRIIPLNDGRSRSIDFHRYSSIPIIDRVPIPKARMHLAPIPRGANNANEYFNLDEKLDPQSSASWPPLGGKILS
jgi:hypothetical protein